MKGCTLVLPILLLACAPNSGEICMKTTCKDYKTQIEAQEDFDLNRTCRENLDRDNDGKPCEHLPDSI